MKHKEASLRMGRVVAVTKIYERAFDERKNGRTHKFWEEKPCEERLGWIVGFRTLQEGHTQFDSEYGNEWRPTGKTYPAILVCFDPFKQPLYVPLDGCRFAEKWEEVSKIRAGNGSWTEVARADLRDVMKYHPRDEKGRWKKYTDYTVEEREREKAHWEDTRKKLDAARKTISKIAKEDLELFYKISKLAKEQRTSLENYIALMGIPKKEKA